MKKKNVAERFQLGINFSWLILLSFNLVSLAAFFYGKNQKRCTSSRDLCKDMLLRDGERNGREKKLSSWQDSNSCQSNHEVSAQPMCNSQLIFVSI